MFQTEQQKREVVGYLQHCIRVLSICIKEGTVTDNDLDLTWTLLWQYAKSRRLLKEFNKFLPENMAHLQRCDQGYILNEELCEVLEQARDSLDNRSLSLRIELAEAAEKRLKRDLVAMNTWWLECTANEREIAFSAIANTFNTSRPARALSSASAEGRLMYLIVAMDAVELVLVLAKKQAARWQALGAEDKKQVMMSIEKHTGMSAKKWWNSVSLAEKTDTLKRLLDVLETQEEADQKGKTSVA